MTNKYNPIRFCSCTACRNGRDRSEYITEANRKFRRISNQQLRHLSTIGRYPEGLLDDCEIDDDDWGDVDRIFVDGGYTD